MFFHLIIWRSDANKQEETEKPLKGKVSQRKLLIANCLIKNFEKCPTEQEISSAFAHILSGNSLPYRFKTRICRKLIKMA